MPTKDEMIEEQLVVRGISDSRVLQAMKTVDRHHFVPDDLVDRAYEDRPLPIGKSQTISQPYIVAFMAEELELTEDAKVLEIGTGCGYNAAVMAQIVKEVYSIEIVEWLASLAKENLAKTDIDNVTTQFGDGFQGWPEHAPFDAITLTAAPPAVPEPLKQQLKVGGKLIAPVGTNSQKLIRLTKNGENDFEKETILMVSFVPMTGKAQEQK